MTWHSDVINRLDNIGYNTSAIEIIAKNELLITVVNETTEHTVYGEEFFSNLWTKAEYFLKCTSLTGTTPTLDVIIEAYDPNIEDWSEIVIFAQLSAAGSERKVVTAGLGWKQRVKYTTADGTTLTDCDFKVGAIFKR